MDRRHVVDCIVVKRLRISTLLKLNLIGNALFHIPVGALIGLSGMTDMTPLLVNDHPLTGIGALLAGIAVSMGTLLTGIVLGIVVTIVFTLMSSLAMFVGLLICSIYRPLKVGFLPLAEEEEHPAPPATAGTP